MTIRTLTVCLLAFPLLVSCVKQGDIDSLNARMNQNEQRMQHLSSQVGNVEQVLPGQAEMWAQMQSMRQELNMVRGQLDEMTSGGGGAARGQAASLSARVTRLENAVRQMAAQLGVQVEALDAPLELPADMPPADPTSASGGTPGASPANPAFPGAAFQPTAPQNTPPPSVLAPATPVAPGAVDTANALYDSGMNAFASRNYREAVKAFTDFTKSFSQHKLASNANFWRGESYYQLKDYAGAALAYQDVIQNYPGSAKFQSAMLKQGMSFYYAGKKEAATMRLNELIKKYPSSPEAGRAKKFLQQNK